MGVIRQDYGSVNGAGNCTCGVVNIPLSSSVEIDTGLSEINYFVLFGYRNTPLTDSAYFTAAVYNKDASTTQGIAVYNSSVAYRNIDPSAYVTNGNIISDVDGGKVTIEGIRQSTAVPNNYHWFAC